MKSLLPLLLGVLLLVLLTWYCAGHVEQDVLATAQRTLNDGGHDWGEVSVDGRYITLAGYAPNADVAASAVSEILSTDAVERVDSEVELHQVTDLDMVPVRGGLARSGMRWVELNRRDRVLGMSGVASTEGGKAEAVGIAVPLWPWGPVNNDIRVASSGPDRQLLACRTSLDNILANDTVHFEFASADISAEGQSLLDQLISVLDDCQEATIRVEAHSDNVGDPASNLTLSQARAESVTIYMERGGIGAERLSAAGYGESRPVASNSTDEGRAENRRVDFRIGQ
ncbi:MAG: outer membrane protein OmpA-like peptidoglycan-associated protein [Rhodothermales bacterium]|jgi:outer membrane protein OmpA-like peptidoglycan-associated protein